MTSCVATRYVAVTAVGTALLAVSLDIEVIGQAPAQTGQWSPVNNWPVVAVHAALLPTGNVLAWTDYTANGGAQLWRPATNTFVSKTYNPTSLFCSAHSFLPDGRLLVAGGIVGLSDDLGPRDTTFFDPVTETWSSGGFMNVGRYYPTTATLGDGRVIVIGGTTTCVSCIADIPEIYNPATNTWTAMAQSARMAFQYYPHVYTLPNGKVLVAAQDDRAISSKVLDLTTQTWTTMDPRVIDGHSSAMYLPGKIIKVGKATADDPGHPSVSTSYTLDTTAVSPTWQATSSMAFPRSFVNLTVLPDGQVLATGGSTTTDPAKAANAVYEAELWSPATRTWTTLARMQRPRLYHSTALLLPDARVLVAGGGRQNGRSQPDPADEQNAEIFSPPYLFKGPRPVISSAPALVQYGTAFTVVTPDAGRVASVSLIALSAVTHAFNENQRYVPLSFQAAAGSLTVTGPVDGNTAPPGPYMLFVVDTNGVPSVAAMVRVPATGEDTQPPSPPGDLIVTGSFGAANLTWSAATDNVGVTGYNVHRSTTPGFNPISSNRIGQTQTTAYADASFPSSGTYYYVVTAQDANGNVSAPSNESAANLERDTTPPVVALTAPLAGATISGTVSVTASASDDVSMAGVQFLLDGNPLGAEVIAAGPTFSVNWTTTTSFNGSHTLSARARDSAGNVTVAANVSVTVVNAVPTGLIAAYSFADGAGTVLRDVSGNHLDGTIVGATWTTGGRYGNALSFNGSTAYVDLGNPTQLQLTGSMTVEAWVKADGTPADDGQVVAKSNGSSGWQFKTSPDTGPHTFGVAVGTTVGNVQRYSTTVRSLNTWYHVAGVYDASARTLSTYVNGVLDNGALVGVVPATQTNSTVNANIGRRTGGFYFRGIIDEVRIYGRALGQGEIQTDMNTPLAAPTPDTIAPTVSLTQPASGAALSGIARLSASASDNVGVAGVQFLLDGAPLGAEVAGSASPYVFDWDTSTASSGSHNVSARARDSANNTAVSAAVSVTVTNDGAPPAVTVTSPAAGATIAGTVPIVVSASDDTGLAGLTVFVDGVATGAEVPVSGLTATHTYAWNTLAVTNGSHIISARARDLANRTTTSASVSVTVANVDSTPPAVAVTSPTGSSQLSGIVAVIASASDNQAMAGVQFLLDGSPMGAEIAGPGPTYTLTWNTASASNGPHTLSARARDNANNIGTATGIGVTVFNDTIPPSVSLTSPTSGATVNGTVTVTATASDNVTVAGVQFLLDAVNLGAEVTGAGPTYTVSWNTLTASSGPHSLSARARDQSGNTALAVAVPVTVSNPSSGRLASYAFSEGTGTTTRDGSGNGLTGTVSGATWTTAGRNGNALSFNGTSNYVNLGNATLLQTTGSMSWAAWVRATGAPADDGQIVAKANNGAGWEFKTSPDTGVHTFAVKVSGPGGSAQRYSRTVRALNVWYHVAAVYNAAARTLDIYVNGVLDNGLLTGTIPSSQAPPSVNVNIGRRTGGFHFRGVIDDLQLFNRALSAAEIQTLMTTPAP